MGKAITRELSEIIENIEAHSGAAFHRSAPRTYATKLGIEATTIGSATLLSARKSNSLYFNRVVGLGLASLTTLEQIEQILDYYAERKVKRFAVELSPLAMPHEIVDWLEKRRFHESGGTAKMWRDGSSIEDVHTDFRIRRIDSTEASDWFTVMSTVFTQFRSRKEWYEARFNVAQWHHYLAYDGNEPVAVAAMYAQDGAAHLTDAATLSGFRRRGIQKAMIHQRVRDGLKLGCDWFTSETAPPTPRSPLVSHRNLRRSGFEMAYIRAKYVWEA